MRVVADLQIHSKYSRATSSNMQLEPLAFFSGVKGLNVIGTGDATHPKWLEEISTELEPDRDLGLYRVKGKPEFNTKFIVTAEVSTVYQQGGRARRIHHVILIPSLEVARQIVDSLQSFGDLEADGRPTLSITSPGLVEKLMEISKDIEVFPAHAWTPWFSLFGANSGFDSIEDCYGDKLEYIHALETGLSSDPPMNWRVSSLDRFTLVSNSDSHSPYPHRLGREAIVFEMDEPSYSRIVEAIRKGDDEFIKFTIETKPEYGKYHWTGHRNCNVSMPAAEAVKLGGKCPVCGRQLTKGVEQRIEQLADRPSGYKPAGKPAFVYVLPLHEIIAAALGDQNPLSSRVQNLYQRLIESFGSEFAVTLDVPVDAISSIAGSTIGLLIDAMRKDRLQVTPGYDGVYGKIELSPEVESKRLSKTKAKLDSFTAEAT